MSASLPAPAPARAHSTLFREAREAEWMRLDALLQRIEKRSIRSLSDEELMALPVLYRAALSSLSIARETALDAALVAFLEQLSTRAYFHVYGVPETGRAQLRRFFAAGWPRAVRAIVPETLGALVLSVMGAILGFAMVTGDPAWFYALIPEGLAGGRNPGASAEVLRAALYTRQQDGLSVFAAYLLTHNSQVALFCFALGFAFGAPTALLLLYNGMILGAFYAVYAKAGLAFELTGWLMIHGTTELFAILLAGAAGFRIGRAIAFPGGMRRMDAAVVAGRTAGPVMGGVVIMLIVAGALEGIGRQLVTADGARYAIAAGMLLLWTGYFYLWRRGDAERR
ncbi:stage II sporulation protein M [uncultured Croceicoccus sp.]|uniref:stage II sporulation protein M n=1 Tax=uncultured Croceicoccus sp. TaxID=1295329 RepID=UPI002614BAE5|nr:stage II sporulation protein M [uncultured Croceicoccus sp.]